jgi:acetoin utilization protein AcuB
MTPAISRYMTEQPWTIGRSESLAAAHALMRKHHVRHLPVVENGNLVGIVSVGDLHLLETIDDFSLDEIPVQEAMTEHPFVVTRDTPLEEVVGIMADKKYGSAIIVGRKGVEGIFTTSDACRALVTILQRVELEQVAGTD